MKNATVVKSLSRGMIALLSITLIGTLAVGQDLVIGGGTFNGSGQYYIAGSITNTAPVTINGAVTLNGTAAQTIGTTGIIDFQTLNVNTTGGFATLAVSTAVSSALSIAAASTFNIQNNTLSIGGTSTRNGTGVLTTGATSTVNFNSAGAQTVLGGVTYNGNLNLSGAGAKGISAKVTVVNAFNASSDLTITDTLAFAASANGTISGNLVNNGTLTAPTTGLITLGGAVQSISGNALTFGNLTIAGTDVKNANANITVQGQLTVNQNLNMDTANNRLLTMTDAARLTQPVYGSLKEVTGRMQWQAFSAQTYVFNNASTEITFSGADASRTFELKSQPSVNPSGYTVNNTVNRKFNSTYTNWSTGTASVTLAYLQAEASGVTENKLRGFQNGISSSNKLAGTPARVTSGATSFGSVTHTNLTNAQLLASNELAIDDQFGIFKSIAATNWDVPATWDATAVPGATDDVEINTKVTVPNLVAAAANSVIIDAGTSQGLTVGGGTSGTLTIGAGGLTNNNSTGDGLTVASGASVIINNGILTNNGAITNAGTIRVQ